MSFGENLQYYRKREEITQEQLAEKMEVSRQTISKWEAGTSYPEMEKSCSSAICFPAVWIPLCGETHRRSV
ncbi:helix-turn-helix domain-containing protein [Blautia sp. RD014234]|nr:helix-turn-helix domain-containing protein [Blautia parvula]